MINEEDAETGRKNIIVTIRQVKPRKTVPLGMLLGEKRRKSTARKHCAIKMLTM